MFEIGILGMVRVNDSVSLLLSLHMCGDCAFLVHFVVVVVCPVPVHLLIVLYFAGSAIVMFSHPKCDPLMQPFFLCVIKGSLPCGQALLPLIWLLNVAKARRVYDWVASFIPNSQHTNIKVLHYLAPLQNLCVEPERADQEHSATSGNLRGIASAAIDAPAPLSSATYWVRLQSVI